MGEYIETRRGYEIYRKVVNGRGRWTAVKVDALGNRTGNPFRISYEQAMGLAPLDGIEALSMQLGSLLLPKRF